MRQRHISILQYTINVVFFANITYTQVCKSLTQMVCVKCFNKLSKSRMLLFLFMLLSTLYKQFKGIIRMGGCSI